MNSRGKIPTLTQEIGGLVPDYFSLLKQLSHLTLAPLSQEKLLESFIDLLTKLLSLEQASVMLWDPVTDELTMEVFRGFTASEAKKCRLRPGEGIAGQVFLAPKPCPLSIKSWLLNNRSSREPDAALYIPLTVGCECRGIITLGSSRQQRPFTPDEEKVASALADHVALVMENTRLNNEISGLSLNFLKPLAMAIDARDNYTRTHSMRVTRYAVMIGVHMGLLQDKIELLRRGALLHDIGKIGIRDSVLLKTRKLTKEEHDIIRKHPEIGARILGPDGPLRLIVPIILHHHERYDGKGYPDGLKGSEIPEGARIIAVADSFEAMTAERPYRRAFSVEKAIRELRQNAGSQFDPAVVKVFLDVLKEDISDLSSEDEKRESGT